MFEDINGELHPGDDLRMVDWNVYARLEQVLVRLFHEDRNLSVRVYVDAGRRGAGRTRVRGWPAEGRRSV